MNTRKIFSIVSLMGIFTLGFSQERMEKRERLEAEKIAYFSSELDLSSEEAKVFWPIYNEFNKKIKSERKRILEDAKLYAQGKKTDEDANALISMYLQVEQAELDLKKEYFLEMSNSISPQKVAKLLTVEKKYKERILKKIRKKMERRKKRLAD